MSKKAATEFQPPADATEAELAAFNAVVRALAPLSQQDRETAFRMLLAYYDA